MRTFDPRELAHYEKESRMAYYLQRWPNMIYSDRWVKTGLETGSP